MTSTDIPRIGSPLMASKDFMRAADRLTTLYAFAEEFNELLALWDDEADDEVVAAEIQRVVGDIRAKGEGLAVVVQTLENVAALQRAEAQRMEKKARANENHAQRLRDYAARCLRMIGLERMETGRFTLSLRQSTRVEITDASLVPSEFQRTKVTIEPDKNAIKAHVKETGEVVPGTEIVRSESLRIA